MPKGQNLSARITRSAEKYLGFFAVISVYSKAHFFVCYRPTCLRPLSAFFRKNLGVYLWRNGRLTAEGFARKTINFFYSLLNFLRHTTGSGLRSLA